MAKKYAVLCSAFEEEFVLPRVFVVEGLNSEELMELVSDGGFESHEELVGFIESKGYKVVAFGTNKKPFVLYSYVDEGVLVTDIENYEN